MGRIDSPEKEEKKEKKEEKKRRRGRGAPQEWIRPLLFFLDHVCKAVYITMKRCRCCTSPTLFGGLGGCASTASFGGLGGCGSIAQSLGSLGAALLKR
jgi:hypothetical protein